MRSRHWVDEPVFGLVGWHPHLDIAGLVVAAVGGAIAYLAYQYWRASRGELSWTGWACSAGVALVGAVALLSAVNAVLVALFSGLTAHGLVILCVIGLLCWAAGRERRGNVR